MLEFLFSNYGVQVGVIAAVIVVAAVVIFAIVRSRKTKS